jgi:uncharacterized protein DUF6941
MQINFAHLCDYASVSREGKLSVMGIFDKINAQQLPYTHPQAFLAFQIEINSAEAGRPFAIEIHCVDADGNEVFKNQGQGRWSGRSAGPTTRPRATAGSSGLRSPVSTTLPGSLLSRVS